MMIVTLLMIERERGRAHDRDRERERERWTEREREAKLVRGGGGLPPQMTYVHIYLCLNSGNNLLPPSPSSFCAAFRYIPRKKI